MLFWPRTVFYGLELMFSKIFGPIFAASAYDRGLGMTMRGSFKPRWINIRLLYAATRVATRRDASKHRSAKTLQFEIFVQEAFRPQYTLVRNGCEAK